MKFRSDLVVSGASAAAHQPTMYLLICAASVIPLETVHKSLPPLGVFSSSDGRPRIRTIPVPLRPPTSEEQAKQWSKDYWPTVYKKNNPFGPHPSIIFRTEEEIQRCVGEWMNLAKLVGSKVSVAQKGEPIGVVVVHRNASTGADPVVVAGDARWEDTVEHAFSGGGNVMAHAVMRAIALVARKRQKLPGAEHHCATEVDHSDMFADNPLVELENAIYSKDTLTSGGYLCLDLELYVTHEPCVMCSMAILHSRFGKVIFGKRLPRTGGISAGMDLDDGDSETERAGLGYGLFWRPELNWKLLGWQWVDDESPPEELSNINTHA